MKPSQSLKSVALVTITAAATMLLIQACGGGSVAQTAGDADPIEGVWESSITIKDCASGAVLGTGKGIAVHHRGGTMTADSARPPATRGVALGTWKRGAGNAYTSHMVFMLFNLDTSLAGMHKVQRSFTLAADGNNITGTNVAQTFNTAGVLVQQSCTSETGVRTNG